MRDRTGRFPRHVTVLPILAIFIMNWDAHADALTFGVDGGVGATDNVAFVHTGKTSQDLAVMDGDFAYHERSLLLDVNLKGDFTDLEYLQGAYHNQFLGRFDGIGAVALFPERLTWTLQDDYGQAAIDPFTPTTPGNLESVNYVSTGPNLALRTGDLAHLDLSARLARVDYETSPFSSNRLLGGIAWGLQLSALSSVSLNADTQRVLFENTVFNSNYTRTDVYGHYGIDGARTQASVELGSTRARTNADSTSTSAPLLRISLSRVLSAAARLNVTFGHDITDGSSSFSEASSLSGATLATIGALPTNLTGGATATVTSESYTRSYASLGWQYSRNRTAVYLTVRWEKDGYAGAPALDRRLDSGDLWVERRITRALAVQFTGRLYKADYPQAVVAVNGSPNDSTKMIGAALIWRKGRALETKLQVQHQVYSTSPNDIGYRENRVLFTVGYRPRKTPQI